MNYSNACLGKKRYNVPTDIEASLDHLSLQACPLVTLGGCDSEPGAITSSVSPSETEQEKPHPVRMVPSMTYCLLYGSYGVKQSVLAC